MENAPAFSIIGLLTRVEIYAPPGQRHKIPATCRGGGHRPPRYKYNSGRLSCVYVFSPLIFKLSCISISTYIICSVSSALARISPLALTTMDSPEKHIFPSVPTRLHIANMTLFWNACTRSSHSNISDGSDFVFTVGISSERTPAYRGGSFLLLRE